MNHSLTRSIGSAHQGGTAEDLEMDLEMDEKFGSKLVTSS